MKTMIDDLEFNVWPVTRLKKNTIMHLCGVGWNPYEHFQDVWPDLDRLIRSIIYGYTDTKNISLHYDELYGEMAQKLTQIINRRDVVFDDRVKFFGMVKLSLTRHLSSLIQKNVFTQKRTGVKSKPKDKFARDERGVEAENSSEFSESDTDETKPSNRRLELDNDDLGGCNYAGTDDLAFNEQEITDALEYFMREHLTEAETRVLRQEIEPNDRALELAFACTKHSARHKTYRICDQHKAQALDMPVYSYKRILGKVRAKMVKYWNK